MCAEFYSVCFGISAIQQRLSAVVHEDINAAQLLLTPVTDRHRSASAVAVDGCPMISVTVPNITLAKQRVEAYYTDSDAVLDGTSPSSFLCVDPDGVFLEVCKEML